MYKWTLNIILPLLKSPLLVYGRQWGREREEGWHSELSLDSWWLLAAALNKQAQETMDYYEILQMNTWESDEHMGNEWPIHMGKRTSLVRTIYNCMKTRIKFWQSSKIKLYENEGKWKPFDLMYITKRAVWKYCIETMVVT